MDNRSTATTDVGRLCDRELFYGYYFTVEFGFYNVTPLIDSK